MPDQLAEFEFLRPVWLLGIPLLFLMLGHTHRRLRNAGWGKHIAADKLAHLRFEAGPRSSATTIAIAATIAIACFALAGPSWRGLPDNVANHRQAMILLLDLSPSMLAQDVKPDRLTLARLKVIDLLRSRVDGDSALIVYAADAFRVAPLTDDSAVIEALVPTLHPDIMPEAGSRPEAAIELALSLFDGASLDRGDIVLITDGVHADAVVAIEQGLRPGFRLSILGIGTEAGAPVPGDGTAFLRNELDEFVIASLDEAPLRALTSRFGGRYASLTVDDADVEYLSALARHPFDPNLLPPGQRFDHRDDAGYWFVLLLLPLVAYSFRRHLLWLAMPFVLIAPESEAADWKSLWLTADQRATHALRVGNAREAAEGFNDPRWRAIALHRSGDTAAAAGLLASTLATDPVENSVEVADDYYNLGTLYALDDGLELAIQAYDEALARYARHGVDDARADDARHNRAEVQALLEKEQQAGAAPPSGSDDDKQENGQENGQEEAPPEDEQPISDATSTANSANSDIGAAAGATSQTLQQEALSGDGLSASGQRDEEPASVPADDATAVQERLAFSGTDEAADARDADNTLPVHEANNNRVLNPYSEQWLRTLPQNPGGYLRQKFHYLSEMRARQQQASPSAEVRY